METTRLRDVIHGALNKQDGMYLQPDEIDALTRMVFVAVNDWIVEERIAGRLISTKGMAARSIEVKPNAWKVKASCAPGEKVEYVHSLPSVFKHGSRGSTQERFKVYANERTAKATATMLRNAGWTTVEVIPLYETSTEL